jgi:cytochrome c oxidase subunit 3
MAETTAEPKPEEHFETLGQQAEVIALGLWVFLATEIMFFGGLFFVYTYYRFSYPMAFAEASKSTPYAIGTTNAGLLIAGGFLMAWAVELAGTPARRLLAVLLLAIAAICVIYLGLIAYEYHLDIADHDLPGWDFAMNRPYAYDMQLFWVLYWAMTGLHLLHIWASSGIMTWTAARAWRGEFTHYGQPIKVLGYFWGFVVIIWIIMWTLLYLPGRSL